ncbi:unnamed protein product [Penicillium salamii]|nr:unnamed protein product [Penicillium salamii]CAG8120368.1 unnamed protein product [Penicillium salamii]CAG8328930.1 unnamed protein product [Penicillium salamii]CAG8594267.1 unnamed protein product [Penicillium salamii]
MENFTSDGFPVDFDDTIMALLNQDGPAAASSVGPSDAFLREFANGPGCDSNLFTSNIVSSQDINGLAASTVPELQLNQQMSIEPQFAPQQASLQLQANQQMSIEPQFAPQQTSMELQSNQQLPTEYQFAPQQGSVELSSPVRASSLDSLFEDDAPFDSDCQIIETPTTSPEAGVVVLSVPLPAKKTGGKRAAKKTAQASGSPTANDMSMPDKLEPVRCPRPLATPQQYAQHVSPFATMAPPAPADYVQPANINPDQARKRIKALTQERSYLQASLRRVTSVDPKTGKNTLQTLESQNANLRRVNTTQSNTNKRLKKELADQRKSYGDLAQQFNQMLCDLQQAQQENVQLKSRVGMQ